MDIREFHTRVKRVEGPREIIFDVRPFGDMQGDAIETYLQARLLGLQMGVAGLGGNPIVLLCDAIVELSNNAKDWLTNLNAQGGRTEIRHAE